MRLVIIIHGYAPRIGGAERQIGLFAPLVKKMGVDVSVLTRRLPGTLAFEVIDGVPVYRLPASGPKPFAALSFIISAVGMVRKLRPDIIHAHEFISPATAALAAHFLYKTPFVLTPHLSGPEGDVQKMGRKFMGRTRLALFRKECAAFITMSREIDAELAGMAVPERKRTMIINGVDTEKFSAVDSETKINLRASLDVPAEAPLAVFAGRLVPIKGVDMLVDVWPRVREARPDARLAIAGTGSLEQVLKQAATDGIQFLGGIDDVCPLMRAGDVLVLPSDGEGLPLSVLEAMSCGLPIIATPVGGIPEAVVDGESGILIPVRDPDRLTEAIIRIFKNPDLQKSMSRKSRERIMEKYTLEEMAQKSIQLYQKVLEEETAVKKTALDG